MATFGKSVFIECDLGNPVKQEGWDNWRNPENEKTAFFAEFKNSGPGAKTEKRVSWSHQLTEEQAEKYTFENILGKWSESDDLFYDGNKK